MPVSANVRFGPVTLGTAAAVLYTCPSNVTGAILKRVTVTNTSAGAVTFTFYVVRAGGSVAVATMMISAAQLAANGSSVTPELANLLLTPGDAIWALASNASVVNVMGSGFTV